jgi:hypothetical protein
MTGEPVCRRHRPPQPERADLRLANQIEFDFLDAVLARSACASRSSLGFHTESSMTR